MEETKKGNSAGSDPPSLPVPGACSCHPVFGALLRSCCTHSIDVEFCVPVLSFNPDLLPDFICMQLFIIKCLKYAVSICLSTAFSR